MLSVCVTISSVVVFSKTSSSLFDPLSSSRRALQLSVPRDRSRSRKFTASRSPIDTPPPTLSRVKEREACRGNWPAIFTPRCGSAPRTLELRFRSFCAFLACWGESRMKRATLPVEFYGAVDWLSDCPTFASRKASVHLRLPLQSIA